MSCGNVQQQDSVYVQRSTLTPCRHSGQVFLSSAPSYCPKLSNKAGPHSEIWYYSAVSKPRIMSYEGNTIILQWLQNLSQDAKLFIAPTDCPYRLQPLFPFLPFTIKALDMNIASLLMRENLYSHRAFCWEATQQQKSIQYWLQLSLQGFNPLFAAMFEGGEMWTCKALLLF